MFERMKERRREKEEERQRMIREERQRLLALSEKELMVEILLRMDRMSEQLEDIDSSIYWYRDRD